MAKNISHARTIIAPPGAAVKARIVAAGVRMGVLAANSGFSNGALTGYLQGRCRNIHGQIRIAKAFRKLTGQRLRGDQFWGDLWAEHDIGKEDVA